MSWSSISKCSSFTRRRCSSRYDIPPWRVEQLHCRDFNSLISPGASDMGQILKGSMWDPFCTVAKCLQLEGGERCMWFLKKWFKNQKITAYGKIRHFFMKIRHFFTFFSLHVFCFLFFQFEQDFSPFFTLRIAQICKTAAKSWQLSLHIGLTATLAGIVLPLVANWHLYCHINIGRPLPSEHHPTYPPCWFGGSPRNPPCQCRQPVAPIHRDEMSMGLIGAH